MKSLATILGMVVARMMLMMQTLEERSVLASYVEAEVGTDSAPPTNTTISPNFCPMDTCNFNKMGSGYSQMIRSVKMLMPVYMA